MKRVLGTAIALLFVGMALAGCTGGNNGTGTSPTNPTGSGGAPQALVSASPISPRVEESVTFTAVSALATDSVAWQFGDGAAGTGSSASHAYSAPGQYVVVLTVTRGATVVTNDVVLTYVTVSPAPLELANISVDTAPLATAASSAAVVSPGATVAFDASGSGAWVANPDYDPTDLVQTPAHNPPFVASGPVTYAWDFGGNGSAETVKANHTFATAGTFPVKLTVTAESGKTSSYVMTIRALPDAPSTPGVRNPLTYIEATISGPESLDPGYDYETAGGQILNHVYETLFYYQRERADVLVPKLSTEIPTKANGGISADGMTYTMKLREGVKFHDGNTMTAEDAKFSLDRTIIMNDPNGPAWILGTIKGALVYSGSDGLAADRDAYFAAGGVTVVDPLTLKITLDHPDPAFLYKLAFTVASVVSKSSVCAHSEPDFIDCMPAIGSTRHPWMDLHEVGTGSFQLDAWIPGQQIILKRFDGYWGTKPVLEKVVIQQVDDINTRLLMLFSGQADSVYVGVDHDIDVVGKLGVRIIDRPSFTISFIGLNQHFCGGASASGFETCMAANGQDAPKNAAGQADPEFFADVHMRKAWAMAFDYETYYNDISKKHGLMANGAVPKGMFGFDETILPRTRDVAGAAAELKASSNAAGFSLTLYYNTGNTVREKASTLMAQNIKEVCVAAGATCTVNAQGLDFSTAFLPKQRAKALPVFFLGWAPDYAYPDDYTVPFLHSTLGVYAARVGYANAAVDKLQDELLKETDEAKLITGYSDLVKMSNEDYPFIWLAQASNYHVQRDWVQGYYYNPMHSGGPNIGDFTTISKK